jgi:formylglycine-generating enzyme required for sulfatase activity
MLASQAALSRPALADWYRRNRERSAQIFALVDAEAYYDRPIPLRHPFAFYEGHLPAFSFLVLNERGLGEAPLDPQLEKLFERGIDPHGSGEARKHARSDWPAKSEIESFGRACDERVYEALAHADFDMQRAYTILEHEPMHHETLMYIVHQLSPEFKGRIAQEHHDTRPPQNEFVHVPAGTATLGAQRDEIPFGWDNEFEKHEVSVPAFDAQRYPVTNGEYLEFVRDGAKPPRFWKEQDGEFFLQGVFEDLPLPLSWPVYVSNAEATAYAHWKGCGVMSEAQYHRAAFGTPSGEERPLPWGAEPPDALHGNFDFQRFDPEPVDTHPAGSSAWGIEQLIGNGWEWTSTPFAPFAGFEPMKQYPVYSADFFDGMHYVMKGASPVTARELIRRSFRNWFYGDYPYMYAKFRLCR